MNFLGPRGTPLASSQPVVAAPAPAVVEAKPALATPAPAAPDAFALLEQQYGKAVADAARQAHNGANKAIVAQATAVASNLPTISESGPVVAAGIGESLMHMRIEPPHKVDPTIVTSAWRRFATDLNTRSNGL